jgi:coenzyme PQQ synthesis protein D (PqqD)
VATLASPDRRRYVRAADVLWRRASGTVVLLSARGGDVFELGGTAVALWDMLALPVTLDEAASALAERFGVAVDVVASDIGTAVQDLVRRGVIDTIEAT